MVTMCFLRKRQEKHGKKPSKPSNKQAKNDKEEEEFKNNHEKFV